MAANAERWKGKRLNGPLQPGIRFSIIIIFFIILFINNIYESGSKPSSPSLPWHAWQAGEPLGCVRWLRGLQTGSTNRSEWERGKAQAGGQGTLCKCQQGGPAPPPGPSPAIPSAGQRDHCVLLPSTGGLGGGW